MDTLVTEAIEAHKNGEVYEEVDGELKIQQVWSSFELANRIATMFLDLYERGTSTVILKRFSQSKTDIITNVPCRAVPCRHLENIVSKHSNWLNIVHY